MGMIKEHEDWFIDWFNSPYYHLLYQNRSYKEAELFINNLFIYLSKEKGIRVLDLACGKGRHARQVHDLSYNVIGLDLSESNIKAAKEFEENDLKFETGDMREIPYSNKFDIVLNLFTSFGYFKKDGENIKVIESITDSLLNGGLLVLDYLNVFKVKNKLPQSEILIRDNIAFNIEKSIKVDFIVKNISFNSEGKEYNYQEYVKLFELDDFKKIFESNGLVIDSVFGDYYLNEFDRSKSDRLIIIAKKK